MALFGFRSQVKDFPSEIVVQYGEVSVLCLETLCCAITIILLTIASPAIVRPHIGDVQEISRTHMEDQDGKRAEQGDPFRINRERIMDVLPNAALC